jgi:hypothetical protein
VAIGVDSAARARDSGPGLDDGRLPIRVRIGVTGHRRLDDPARVREEVRRRLGQIAAHFPASDVTDVVFTVLSALAEGADRIVAEETIAFFGPERAELVAVLPLDPDDYAADFETPESKDAFHEALDGASHVIQTRWQGGRDEAYWQAGRAVVERCDVLIAVWDGRKAQGHGGTAEVIDYAVRREVPVLTVLVGDGAAPPGEAPALPAPNWPPPSWRRLDEYNSLDRRVARRRRAIEAEGGRPEEGIADPGVRALYERIATWSVPRYARAEVRARAYQRQYYLVVDLLFGLAALAVAAVAWQTSFHPDEPLWTLLETAALSLAVAGFWYGRHRHLHDAWIGYRSLAEAFRSAQFLALVGAGQDDDGRIDPSRPPARTQQWFRRAFTEAWRRRPAGAGEHHAVGALRDVLVAQWIDPQIRYHRRTAERAERRHHGVTVAVEALLGVAIVLSLFHAFGVAEEHRFLSELLVFLAIALPGLSAALTGHREQRQYRLHAERSRRTSQQLEHLRDELLRAGDLVTLRRLAGEVQAMMVAENLDWYGVVELQELEVAF